RTLPALHELDCDAAGFEWLVMDDAERSVFAWLRKGRGPQQRCLGGVNFTPEIYRDYRIKVPFSGRWREVLNTDAGVYGGSNVGNGGAVNTLDEGRISEGSPFFSAPGCNFSRPGALTCGSRPGRRIRSGSPGTAGAPISRCFRPMPRRSSF